MENEDKIFEKFKSAANNSESKEFSAIDKVWNRVEEKLDNTQTKKATIVWKKIAVAACLLLFGTLGFQFLNTNQPQIKPNQTIVAKDSIETQTKAEDAVVTSEPTNPAIKKEAVQILQQQIKPESQVAMETKAEDAEGEAMGEVTASPVISGYSSAKEISVSDESKSKTTVDLKKAAARNVEMFMNQDKQGSELHKDEPLVVIDNKVEKKSLKNLEFDDDESLVVLNNPLYIINGVQYTEQQVFGPNPTSPYSPLKKQDIETISILQDEKAVEIYGEKGKKGVVIITTKNGKPVSASKKAK